MFSKLKLILPVALLLCFTIVTTSAQDKDRKIFFPDVAGYKTLKTDFHIHTVFSDGHVWPTIRVEEAVKDGLDAIAITDHIEYQPWKKDFPVKDLNRSYEVAKEAAKAHDLIVVHGIEITRNMPPGHANALFITDANKLNVKDSLTAYREARKQGAFIFWNHPNWISQQKNAIPTITEFHKNLIKEDLLHGIEVVNDITFSEEALDVAFDNNLTVIGTSDVHGLVDYTYGLAEGNHRPICLVFAKKRSEESIKEALFARRTVTWFDNILAGREDNMKLLIDASLSVKLKGYIGDSEVYELEIKNESDARFILQNNSPYSFHRNTDVIELLPHATTMVQVITTKGNIKTLPLKFKILNAVVGNNKVYNWEVGLKN